MRELGVDLRIGLVAARGNVEVVDVDPRRFVRERHGDMARVALDAEIASALRGEAMTGDDSDAVVTLLAVERDVRIAEPMKLAARELPVGAFGLLQAEHVRLVLGEEARDEIDAQPHRIDVPGREGKTQRGAEGWWLGAGPWPVMGSGPSARGRLPTGRLRRRCKLGRRTVSSA